MLRTAVLALSLVVDSAAFAATAPLHTRGTQIVDGANRPVQLRGFNLGGLYTLEHFMVPMGQSGDADSDTYSVMATLEQRFGVDGQRSLMQTYQDTWITPHDLDSIQQAGLNLVRIPVWWGQFFDLDDTTKAGWRSDAFAQLDKVVDAAAQRHLYVVIDLHGAVGSQSFNVSTGQGALNRYWRDPAAQASTAWMWWQIAHHYRGNPWVAGYDLLNEPDARSGTTERWTRAERDQVVGAYAQLYNAVRQADPEHMVFIEDTFSNWRLDMLPDPAIQGWRNVVYEMHLYPWSKNALPGESRLDQLKRGVDHLVSDVRAHEKWAVPAYVGEFNTLDDSPESWRYAIDTLDKAGLNWTVWTYKSSNSPVPNHWGWYVRRGWAGEPDLLRDSAEVIDRKWQRWKTDEAFQRNVTLGIGP